MNTPLPSDNSPLIIAIVGASREAGTSLIGSNMAIQFAKAGLHTILVDHELGIAHMQEHSNIKEKDSEQQPHDPSSKLCHFLMEEGIANLLFIPGNNLGLDFIQIDADNKTKFFNKIKEISSADVVIIDLNASAQEQSYDIFLMAHAGLIVTTTETAGILSGYEFFKNAIYRTVHRMFRGMGELEHIVKETLLSSQEQDMVTIAHLAERLSRHSPWAAQMLLEVCKSLDFYMVINQAHSLKDINLGRKLHEVCQKFLSVDVTFAGLLYYDDKISAHTDQAAPFSISHPTSPTTLGIHRIGKTILQQMIHEIKHGTRSSTFEEQLASAAEYAANNVPEGATATPHVNF